MRIRRSMAAALATIALYVASIVAAPSLISVQTPSVAGVIGTAVAAPVQDTPDPSAGATANIQPDASTQSTDPNTVNQDSCASKDGSFSWLLCPFFDGVSHTFADGAQQLISNFLAVQPLQQSGPIYQTWSSLRDLADALFVIVFLVVIFAQTTQFNLSAYAIKRMLPKLVASAILVQFSFVLVSVVIDSGNILGAGVGQLISSTVGHGGQTSSFDVGTLLTNLVGGGILVALAAVAWEMAFPLFLMVLITVFATILTLALRYVILGVLIVVSPLAFAAWVLPNTERYFNTWLNTLIKLVLMYPIIVALLSLAANVDGLIPTAAVTNGTITSGITTTIIKVMVFIACFAAIPQTFKWAGGAMAQAHGAVDGMRSWGHKRVRESDNWKNKAGRTSSRQIERANKIEAGLRPFLGSDNALARMAGGTMMTAGSILLAGRTGTSSAGRQRGSSQLVTADAKKLESMREATPRMMQQALIAHYATGQTQKKALETLREGGAESLREFTTRIEGRQALVRQLADKGLLGRETLSTIQNHSRAFQRPHELQMALRENGKNIRDNPAMFARFDRSDPTKNNVLGVGHPVRMGDINIEAAKGFYKGVTARRFATDFGIDNLKLMSDQSTPEALDMARQTATITGEYLSADAMQHAFTRGGQSFAPADKRLALLEGMADNQAAFMSTPQGQHLWSTIVGQINSDRAADPNAHDDVVSELSAAQRATLGIP